MAENSAISWTDHTWNPWIGCARISPACDGCYAAGQFGMDGGRFPKRAQWGGPGKGEGTRSRTSEDYWKKPLAWNRKAAKDGTRPFVFCASLADVFDNAVPPEWRRDLFDLLRETPNLTWLLLTKRPGMIVKLWKEIARPGEEFPSNVILMCSVINQPEADRDVPKLLAAKVALGVNLAGLSMEPLLGPVDIRWSALNPAAMASGRIDWVITGGETDQKTEDGMHRARPADPAWFRSLRDQCATADVPFHFKQWGEYVNEDELPGEARLTVACTDFPPAATGFDADRRRMRRVGKAHDPCTLDRVLHRARPVPA